MAAYQLYPAFTRTKQTCSIMNFYFRNFKPCILILFLLFFTQLQSNAQESEKELKFPNPKREDITVDHVMEVVPKAVGLVRNPTKGNLWYTTVEGDVYEIKGIDT